MSVVINDSRASAFDQLAQDSVPARNDGSDDPVIAAARTAGRVAGERLSRTPLNPRQRAVVASVMGGGAR